MSLANSGKILFCVRLPKAEVPIFQELASKVEMDSMLGKKSA
jgi:hypothetical protein